MGRSRFFAADGTVQIDDPNYSTVMDGITVSTCWPAGDDDPVLVKLREILDARHSRFDGRVHRITFPSKHMTSEEAASDILATAWAGGHVTFWPEHLRSLSLLTFEHEAAHAAGDDNSVPRDLAGRWEKARAADARHYRRFWRRSLRRSNPSAAEDGVVTYAEDSMHRRHDPASGWVSSYAADQDTDAVRLREDWAEAVSFYLHAQRQDGVLFTVLADGREIRFDELFPHRAKLIAWWLKGQPRRKFGVKRRQRVLNVGHRHITWMRADHEDRPYGRIRVYDRRRRVLKHYGRGRG